MPVGESVPVETRDCEIAAYNRIAGAAPGNIIATIIADHIANTTRMARHLVLAELPAVRVHDLRHTHASLLVAAGVHPKAIQARMGHASITTTLNTYGHLMPSAFQGVGERLDALLHTGTLERKKEAALK